QLPAVRAGQQRLPAGRTSPFDGDLRRAGHGGVEAQAAGEERLERGDRAQVEVVGVKPLGVDVAVGIESQPIEQHRPSLRFKRASSSTKAGLFLPLFRISRNTDRASVS